MNTAWMRHARAGWLVPRQRGNHGTIMAPCNTKSYQLCCNTAPHHRCFASTKICFLRARRLRSQSSGSSSALVLSDDDSKYFKELAGEFSIDNAVPQDFYQLLGVANSASEDDIKAAYRRLQRIVHPDVVGSAATDLAVLLNAAYSVLMDVETRGVYDAALVRFRSQIGSYTGRPVSQWAGAPSEERAVFVDETTCIGCRQCTYTAPSTFFMEDEWGRARVRTQWGDEEESVKVAMELCPVTCIYFVKRSQLPLLEYVMKACRREDTAMMARRRSGNMGMSPASENPFAKAESMMRNRDIAQVLAEAERGAGGRRAQDEVLAAAISRAWLALPVEARTKGWPEWEVAAAEAAGAA